MLFLTILAASSSNWSAVLVIPFAAYALPNLDFSPAQDTIFQKSSSAVYKSCDTCFNLDSGFNNPLNALSDETVAP